VVEEMYILHVSVLRAHRRIGLISRSEILHAHLSADLRDYLYPKDQNAEAAEEKLKQTAITQPALFVIEYALASVPYCAAPPEVDDLARREFWDLIYGMAKSGVTVLVTQPLWFYRSVSPVSSSEDCRNVSVCRRTIRSSTERRPPAIRCIVWYGSLPPSGFA